MKKVPIITVTGNKGGVGKTTISVHLAAVLAAMQAAKVVLVDCDPNRSALQWYRGCLAAKAEVPFSVVGEHEMAVAVREGALIVVDTEGHPSNDDLEELARGCDLLILPVTPDRMAIEPLVKVTAALESFEEARYRVLFNRRPNGGGHYEVARQALEELDIPMFKDSIRDTRAFWWAADQRVLVKDAKPRSPAGKAAWLEIVAVGRQIVEEVSSDG